MNTKHYSKADKSGLYSYDAANRDNTEINRYKLNIQLILFCTSKTQRENSESLCDS